MFWGHDKPYAYCDERGVVTCESYATGDTNFYRDPPLYYYYYDDDLYSNYTTCNQTIAHLNSSWDFSFDFTSAPSASTFAQLCCATCS